MAAHISPLFFQSGLSRSAGVLPDADMGCSCGSEFAMIAADGLRVYHSLHSPGGPGCRRRLPILKITRHKGVSTTRSTKTTPSKRNRRRAIHASPITAFSAVQQDCGSLDSSQGGLLSAAREPATPSSRGYNRHAGARTEFESFVCARTVASGCACRAGTKGKPQSSKERSCIF